MKMATRSARFDHAPAHALSSLKTWSNSSRSCKPRLRLVVRAFAQAGRSAASSEQLNLAVAQGCREFRSSSPQVRGKRRENSQQFYEFRKRWLCARRVKIRKVWQRELSENREESRPEARRAGATLTSFAPKKWDPCHSHQNAKRFAPTKPSAPLHDGLVASATSQCGSPTHATAQRQTASRIGRPYPALDVGRLRTRREKAARSPDARAAM
jgi:hypothetical protein